MVNWPSGGAFHWAHGIFFTRLEDGSVRLRRYPAGTVAYLDEEAEFDFTIPPNEWASIVASMTAAGESYQTWHAAYMAQIESPRA